MAGSGTAQLRRDRPMALTVRNLVVEFPAAHGEHVHAVSDVSFDIAEGETLGLVGESGCGKSTTAETVTQLVHPVSGSVVLDGTDLSSLDSDELRSLRPRFQMIFQDPVGSLNPRRRVRDVVAEPLRMWRKGERAEWEHEVRDVLESVGLDLDEVGDRRPREFSGGQAQRISIARALVLRPRLLVCDEPVSSLDVSVQAQIINLLASMQKRLGLTMLFIAHDLAVVKNVSDRLAVMYLGKLCEIGDAERVYERPAHPYTQALMASVPSIGAPPQPPAMQGEVPSAVRPPHGCRFQTRCPLATELCQAEEPTMREIGTDHFVACHHADVGPRRSPFEPVAETAAPVPVGVRLTGEPIVRSSS